MIDKNGLSLNIDTDSNALDFELAKSVGTYFQLDNKQMDVILTEVKSAVSQWKNIAQDIGISRQEQELMERAFRYWNNGRNDDTSFWATSRAKMTVKHSILESNVSSHSL